MKNSTSVFGVNFFHNAVSPLGSLLLSILTLLLTLNSTAQEVGRMTPLVSPELGADNMVTLRIKAPMAKSVEVSGNWMPMMQNGAGMTRQTVKMMRGEDGVWSVEVGPMKPELYSYTFLVDSVTTLDPANKHVARDGIFRIENVLYIPGETSDLYWPKKGPKGSMHQVWYESPTLGITRRMYVYTPPGYQENDYSYPVLYLLHGGGGDEEAWPTLGVASTIMDNLINQGKAQPMLVVMTNGNPGQAAAYTASPKLESSAAGVGGMASMLFEESLVNDVVPYIEKHYRVKANPEHRALTGLSMGGLQTMNTTFENPGMFDYIGVMSMGFADLSRFGIEIDHSKRQEQILNLKKSSPKLYWIAIGTDDFLYESVVTMRKQLDDLDFNYIYRESTGGHTWTNWRIYLSEFAPMLFK